MGNWIDEAAAVDAAEKGVRSHGLDADRYIALALQSGSRGRSLFVERLDDDQVAYYLVPWLITERIAFVAQIDARTGEMLGTTTFPVPIHSPFLTPAEALSRSSRRFPERTLGALRLVWQPCRESTSPIRPFYELSTNEGAVYVDMDGIVLEELTPLGRGG